MKAYIHSAYTLSVVGTPETGVLHYIDSGSRELIQPSYKTIVPAAQLRRMTKVIRMGVGAAINCANESPVAGIIVGTGLGCFDNSIQFAMEYGSRREGILSPGSFIVSTENTIAGQVGILLQNTCYNMTYCNKGLSFENALLDGLMLAKETNENILVGGVDESLSIFEIAKAEQPENYWTGEGASFFLLNKKPESALARIDFCVTRVRGKESIQQLIDDLLQSNSASVPDLILYGNSYLNKQGDITYNGIKIFNYSDRCGIYFSNSALATQLATDIFSKPDLARKKNLSAERILIVNNYNDHEFGFIHLNKP